MTDERPPSLRSPARPKSLRRSGWVSFEQASLLRTVDAHDEVAVTRTYTHALPHFLSGFLPRGIKTILEDGGKTGALHPLPPILPPTLPQCSRLPPPPPYLPALSLAFPPTSLALLLSVPNPPPHPIAPRRSPSLIPQSFLSFPHSPPLPNFPHLYPPTSHLLPRSTSPSFPHTPFPPPLTPTPLFKPGGGGGGGRGEEFRALFSLCST